MAYILKDSQTTDNDFWNNATGREYLGTSFTAGSSYTLHRVELKLNKTGTPTNNVVCQIYSDSAGLPGTVLATNTNTVPASGLPAAADYTPQFEFAGLAITNGTKYHIVIHGDGGSGGYGAGGNVQWRSNTAGAAGQTVSEDTDGVAPFGTTSANSQNDFKTYFNDSATTTFFLNNPLQGGSNAGLLDVAAPTASTSTTGWTVGTTGATNYSRMTYNLEVGSGNFTGTAQPSSAPVNSGEDCFRLSGVTTGQFSGGTWYSSLSVIGVSSGGVHDGRGRFRLWRSASADLTSATELTQGAMVGSRITGLSTNVAQSSSASTFIAASNLTNEFLIMQVAWEPL